MLSSVSASSIEIVSNTLGSTLFSFSSLRDLKDCFSLCRSLNRDLKTSVNFRVHLLSVEMKDLWDLAAIVDKKIRELTNDQSFIVGTHKEDVYKKFVLDTQSYCGFEFFKRQYDKNPKNVFANLKSLYRSSRYFKESFLDALCSSPLTVLEKLDFESESLEVKTMFRESFKASQEQVCALVAIVPRLPKISFDIEENYPPCLRKQDDGFPQITIQAYFSYCNAETLDQNNTLCRYGLPSPFNPRKPPECNLPLEDFLHVRDGKSITCLWQAFDNTVLRFRIKCCQEALAGTVDVPEWAVRTSFDNVLTILIDISLEEGGYEFSLEENPFGDALLDFGRKQRFRGEAPESISYTFSRFSQ
jgi:hypothetical protein